MFIRNSWYVAAMGEEVGRAILARRILDRPLVLYRTENGTPVALDDCCAHRGLPLSLGRLTGDLIQCGYHGLAYDRAGQCVHVPAQTTIPPDARVGSYPIVEKWGWLWIWMGEPALADDTKIPDFHWLDDPGWRAMGERIPVKCDYRYLVDNLLDLSHLSFVHMTTIGVAAVAEAAEVRTERLGADGVRISRWMFDCPPPPTYTRAAGLTTNIDRWQIIDFTAPCYVTIDLGGKPAGTGALEGKRDGAILRRSMNALTPETATSCHYFWADAQSFALDDPSVTRFMFEEVQRIFREDVAIVEAQQLRRDETPDFAGADINADAGALEARRIQDRLVAQEQSAVLQRRAG